ncbi:intraflagellar transport protein 80 [Trypanosoma theileri]|uniref:Intraflagellar transport protein 80 n=1 Tax=Trypanosoma theileri TaxID=67003 RepID=A0A1X0P6J7_9TRYP|nr:intraflagellar transport protein 80 [Trypanosoma theileri]ORC92498.1 intraflagellar transport protein 80 [Trypanosoma theileri]
MRLNITTPNERHEEACTCVAVSLMGDVISAGDDFVLRRWSANGEALGKVQQFDSCITYITWVPVQGGRRGRGAAAGTIEGKDNCLVACADGTFSFLNAASGRVERTVDAHIGTITGLVYSADASSIVSSGEDGCVKVWSQAGIPRTTLVSAGKCVYALCWGSETTELGGDCVLYCVGSDVIIKPLNPTIKKQHKWKAHNGVVLTVDWSLMTGYIVTGGEDGTYKVWDPYGRSIYVSAAGEHPCTSVKFSADGEMFAVGSFMNIRVCDKTGWSHTYERLPEGSALSLQWTTDGTQVVMGCGSGAVCTAQLVDRKLYWSQYCVTLVDGNKLLVQDVLTDAVEELELRDKVIKLELGHGYLVACTTTQCACYPIEKLSAPVQFDLRDVVITLILGPKQFLLADCNSGMQVYSYEGRQICLLRLQATLRPEIMAPDLLSLSSDTVAMRNPADAKKILFFDTNNGKPIEEATIVHHLEVVSLELSQPGAMNDRKIAFVDRNRDLYFGTVHQKLGVQKISTMASNLAWHDTHEILVAIADGHLTTWYYPTIVFSDRDLLPTTKIVRDDVADEFTQNDRIVGFNGTRVSVRCGLDGALLTFNASPYPSMIFEHVARHDWSGAMRLARFLDEKPLWGILTGLALRHGELNVAEVGYGALFELDKVRYMRYVKSIPTPEGRQAELALFQRRPAEAERILMQAGLIYRCIDMHTRLFNWERALEIAVERKTHVDTVLARRQKYLRAVQKPETLPMFNELAATVQVDWDTVQEKVRQELAKEAARPGARPYQ